MSLSNEGRAFSKKRRSYWALHLAPCCDRRISSISNATSGQHCQPVAKESRSGKFGSRESDRAKGNAIAERGEDSLHNFPRTFPFFFPTRSNYTRALRPEARRRARCGAARDLGERGERSREILVGAEPNPARLARKTRRPPSAKGAAL